MSLQDKIFKNFEGKVVRKDLTKTIKGNAVVPSYVLEYLLGQHCASFDQDIIDQGLVKVKSVIKDHFVHRDEAEYVKSTIKEKGEHRIIDKLTATLNEKKDIYEATFSNLGISKVQISSDLIKKHKRLLSGGGVWCIINMGYLASEESDSSPWIIDSLKPIQISSVDIEEFINLRVDFTKEEWVDLLISSMGLEPEHFNFRSKLLQIARLIPFCENNFNFIELGPKGTGKSHIFSELSPHGILVSGGDVSQAKLFVNNSNNKIGLVGFWDVITFDEFAGSTKKPDKKLVDIMKNYMANKSFSRGRDVLGATAAFAFVGNTEHAVPYMLKNSNLFDALPKAYYDSAFLDRLHLYIPGWEISKLRNEMFTDSYGFIVDYLAEILKEMRKEDYSSFAEKFVDLDSSLTTRDREGILKTFSGLAKILYPGGTISYEETIELIEFAMESRKRVKDQLIKMDDTFENVSFVYHDKRKNKEIRIETLENIKHLHIQPDDESEENADVENEPKKETFQAKPGQIILSDNQEGVSFKMLFAAYLKEATEIKLVDPYIRYPHQFRLLLEFCSLLAELKEEDQEINLEVISWNEPDEKLNESIENFKEVAESVFDLGIHMEYDMNPNVHDRSIRANNGWKIILGRGLDIYLKPEGRFNIADVMPEKRKCKACEITYIRQ
ncbi:MAG: BREX system Lon protease-like protein BrxL [Calditrichaeota bacterium]|nr:MAG: BREX system Lon protease-like protein BrxL [Calditrichota bacterium]MBL1207142.1 BREX system Lon protease-like protein BrxL [Calditrichota bacterium]NOG46972.1 BREX system Lon protease-like protein BrxL [Calditrichota bacterium]